MLLETSVLFRAAGDSCPGQMNYQGISSQVEILIKFLITIGHQRPHRAFLITEEEIHYLNQILVN